MAQPASHAYSDSWDTNETDSPWFGSSQHYDEEDFELINESDYGRPKTLAERPPYEDGTSIDWLHEEAAERVRIQQLHSHRGLRALLLPALDASRFWLIVVVTGIGIGVTGAWLDVLVKWLADLREGRCAYGFFYNQVACCSGLVPGELCIDWHTWSKHFNVHSILLSSLLQSFIYIGLAAAFAGSAAVLVQTYAPYAFHTGIPEIKAILSGYVFDEFLGAWTLLIKALGLALAVASGLSLGKEGPLVHVACCMAYLLSSRVKQFRQNEGQKRRILAAAAAAGVSVAFGSPLGGVLFGLEELDTFSNETDVMWRGFVTSVIAAMALQYVDPFGTSKLVLFQVTNISETWRAFELVPWLALGVIGGCLGSLLIKLNVAAALYRRNSILHEYPVLEVIGVASITGCVCYLVVFLRVESSELVANLFQECDPTRDYHGLCNPTATLENIFLLTLTAAVKIVLTAWTFGMKIPAGIFMPTIAIGACIGRAVGLMTQAVHRSYPDLWVFTSCPPDPSIRCISPGFYAVIGSAAMLAGVTRMTISLVVILFELTGALSHVLPIMISVVLSKVVADAIGGKEGIYTVWIAMRRYPWLPSDEHHDNGETAAEVMTPVEKLVCVDNRNCTLASLVTLVKGHRFSGFPVVHGEQLMGYVPRDILKAALDALFAERQDQGEGVPCTFETGQGHPDSIDLSSLLEGSVVHLRKEVPQELVVSTFQKMNLRYILFTDAGKLSGMVTRTDIVSLLSRRFPHTGALVEHE